MLREGGITGEGLVWRTAAELSQILTHPTRPTVLEGVFAGQEVGVVLSRHGQIGVDFQWRASMQPPQTARTSNQMTQVDVQSNDTRVTCNSSTKHFNF